MTRPVYVPRFIEDEKTIRDRIVDRIPDTWRKEPGDFIHDAVAATPLEVQTLQMQADYILRNAHAQYATGEWLDNKLAEVGLTRGAATPNKRLLLIDADAGVVIPKGHTVSVVILDGDSNPVEYTVDDAITYAVAGPLPVAATCKTAGVVGNVPLASQFILLPPLPGVRLITDDGTTVPGADQETDDSAYDRYIFKARNPDTGGNKNDYVRWAQEVTGVGKAKTLPIWNGPGTVKVLVVDTEYVPASVAIVAEVQEYLDPGIQGLGDGKAPCGAAVTVVAATDLPIAITATVSYFDGVDPLEVKAAFEVIVRDYLKSLVFTGGDVVRAKIGSLLIGTYGVSNYGDLTLNGLAADVTVGAEAVATLGAVTI